MKPYRGYFSRCCGLAAMLALASGCVSGSTQPSSPTALPQYSSIDSAALNAGIVDPNGQHVGEQTLSLAATAGDQPIPPAANVLAANGNANSLNEQAQRLAASNPPTIASGPVPNSVPTPAVRHAAPAPATNQPVAVAALQPETTNSAPIVTPEPAGQQTTPTTGNSQQTKPAKKPSFLSRLFGAKRKKNRLIATDDTPGTRTASLTAPTVKRPANGLPGVKSNAQILGIEEAQPENGDRTQLASLGSLGRLSPNGLRLQHEKVQVACLKQDILQLLAIIERHYGKKPIITSGYRSPKRNRRAGGAKNSMHIFCKAVDIQVEGVSKWDLAKYLRTIPGRGGVGTYCRTRSVHIDTGKVRDWHYPCRRSSKRRKKKA